MQDARARGNDAFVAKGTMVETLDVRAIDALRWATLSGAKALNLADRTGSLEPGKDADLIIIRAEGPELWPMLPSPGTVVMHAHPSDITEVMIRGTLVKERGRLVGIDYTAERHSAEASAERLLGARAREGGDAPSATGCAVARRDGAGRVCESRRMTTPAVVALHLQHYTLDPDGYIGSRGASAHAASKGLVANVARVFAAARDVGAPVVHVGLGFDEDYTGMNAKLPIFAGMRAAGEIKLGSRSAEFAAGIAPEPADIVLHHSSLSPFSGTPLDRILVGSASITCSSSASRCAGSSKARCTTRSTADTGCR